MPNCYDTRAETHRTGRIGNDLQNAERARLIAEGVDMRGRDVFHSPDQYPGGRADSFTGAGNSGVNRSIARQWRGVAPVLIDAADEAVQSIDPDLLPYVRLRVSLSRP